MKEVGTMIRKIRNDHKHTLTYLAKKLDFDPAHLSRMETGKKPISIETLKRIADFYNVSISYFFEGDDYKEFIDLLSTKKLLLDGELLSEDERERAIEIIKIMLKKKNTQ